LIKLDKIDKLEVYLLEQQPIDCFFWQSDDSSKSTFRPFLKNIV